ncbi:MAG: hypothetical protein AB7V46_12450 [Thermomicrobiales bacterium]
MSRRYKEANPEKLRESKRRWREANPEKYRESRRRWLEANPEKHREHSRKSYREKSKLWQMYKLFAEMEAAQSAIESAVQSVPCLEGNTVKSDEVRKAINDASKIPTEELKRLFSEGFKLQREWFATQAGRLKVLDDRGVEVEGDKRFMDQLRRIYRGELLPEVIVKFACRPKLAGRIGALPASEQKKLVKEDIDAVAKKLAKPRKPKSSSQAISDCIPDDEIVRRIIGLLEKASNQAYVASTVLPQFQHVAQAKHRRRA